MSASTHGTIFSYGVSDTSTAYGVVVSKDLSRSFRNITESKNETGNVVGVRMDDWVETGTLTVQLDSGAVLPAIGVTLAVKDIEGDSVNFIVTEIGRAESNTDNVRVTLGVRKDEGF